MKVKEVKIGGDVYHHPLVDKGKSITASELNRNLVVSLGFVKLQQKGI